MKKIIITLLLIIIGCGVYAQNGNLGVKKLTASDSIKGKTLTVTGKYTLPDIDGLTNYLVRTNGSGKWNYVSPSNIGQDSLYVLYCCGCTMIDDYKAIGDTLKIDTCYVNRIIKDSLNAHSIILNYYIQDSAKIVHWFDLDTLSNSVYDSLSNHYDLIHGLDTGKVSTSGDIMYGDLTVNAKINAIDTIKAPYIKITNQYTLPTTDGTNGQGIVTDGAGNLTWGMSFDSLKCYSKLFMDSIESCINELYLKADTTTLSSKLKLQTFSSLGRPVLTVKDLSGNIDTTETIDIETTPFGFITLTDSLNIGGITYYNYSGNILDDASFSFPLNSYGFGNVYVFNAGMKVEYCRFILNIDGSFELQDNSGNVEFSNVDGNVCLYSNAIQNRLGGTRYFMIELKKN